MDESIFSSFICPDLKYCSGLVFREIRSAIKSIVNLLILIFQAARIPSETLTDDFTGKRTLVN